MVTLSRAVLSGEAGEKKPQIWAGGFYFFRSITAQYCARQNRHAIQTRLLQQKSAKVKPH